jgi:hypothetical protein
MNQGWRPHDEAGMVGRVVVVWLVVLALLGIAAIDSVSIVIARLHTADVAGNAASDAAANFQQTHDVRRACEAAKESVDGADPRITLMPHGCKIDQHTGDATVVVHKDATTVIAGRLGLTKKWVSITDSETAPAPTL